jgi:hypothetical protein
MASLRANDAILDADFRVSRGCRGGPLTDEDRFALAMSQIVGRRLTYTQLTGQGADRHTPSTIWTRQTHQFFFSSEAAFFLGCFCGFGARKIFVIVSSKFFRAFAPFRYSADFIFRNLSPYS